MSSGMRGAKVGDSSMNSHQVSDNIEIGNGGSSLSDFFGYSSEFEHQLKLDNQHGFKITSLLTEPENDDAYLQFHESLENQKLDLIGPNFGSSQEGDVMMKELINPPLNKVHGDVFTNEKLGVEVNEQSLDSPSPPIATYSDDPKPRLLWNPKLHAWFSRVVKRLGGSDKATPKYIQHLMDVQGLTYQQVKSHLQKYRQGKHSVRNWVPRTSQNALATLALNNPSNSLTFSNFLISKPQGKPLSYSAISAKKGSKGKGKAQRDKGSLYNKMQGELNIKRFQASQYYSLNIAMQNACKKIAFHSFGSNGIMGSDIYHGQVTNLGTMATMPTSHPEQPHTYTSHNSIEATTAYTPIQQQENSFGVPNAAYSQADFAYPHEGFLDTPTQTSQSLETLGRYDPIETYLNYEDTVGNTILEDNYFRNWGDPSNF